MVGQFLRKRETFNVIDPQITKFPYFFVHNCPNFALKYGVSYTLENPILLLPICTVGQYFCLIMVSYTRENTEHWPLE